MYIIFFALSFTLRHPPTFCRSPSTTIRFAVIRPPPPSAILSFALRYSVFRQNATHYTPSFCHSPSDNLRHYVIRSPPFWHSPSATLCHSVICPATLAFVLRHSPLFCHSPFPSLQHSLSAILSSAIRHSPPFWHSPSANAKDVPIHFVCPRMSDSSAPPPPLIMRRIKPVTCNRLR